MPRLALLLFILASSQAAFGQDSGTERHVVRPGVKEVQLPFGSIKPSATFKIGGNADWVLIGEDAVWVAGIRPFSLQRIDPATNKVVAVVKLPAEACAGLEVAFGTVWVPLCTKKPSMVRVDLLTNKITAMLHIGPAGEEGGITASRDSVWIVTDKHGTLTRIDPATNSARQKIHVAPGSFNPLFCDGIIWITGFETNVLTAVEASSGDVLASIPVGPEPRFLTAGGGSIWTLNQGDGTVSRVEVNSKKLIATIQVGVPGTGGELSYGANSVWATVFDVPLTRIDPGRDKVVRQWVGTGGDSLRFGYDSIWLTDYYRGLLWRIPYDGVLRP